MQRWLVWAALGVVLVGALVVGTRGSTEPLTRQEQVRQIGLTVRCPQCDGQAAANSEAASAVELRKDIARRLDAGESAEEIRAAYVASYGQEILMNPPRSGFAALVWVLPVAGLFVAVAALAMAFRRWQAGPADGPTDADRALVERARREEP